ncbi:MAG: hypothetical protein M0C28_11530 [Candidatus Moduliflexus flocculans]|nr:hypothetical protein [Candidatus Moduliflexus flocculans]
MHDHQHEARRQRCEMCHGKIEYGTDGGKLLLEPGLPRPQVAGGDAVGPKKPASSAAQRRARRRGQRWPPLSRFESMSS